MSQNMVTQLPVEMGQMDTLQQLDVAHNPMFIPPGPEINKGTRNMIEWLREHEKQIREGKVKGLGVVDITDKKQKE